MFGRSRAKRLKEEAQDNRLVSGATLAAALSGARPVAERLLDDDDLRDNVRTFIESARKILDELSDESPAEIVARLWDDDKLRREVEAAVEALQEGSRRVRGQRVKRGGGLGKKLLLLGASRGGVLFL